MGKRSVSVRYKSKEERAKDPGADTTSRLTVPGPHSHPSTPKSRPKRCVETPGDPWDASQPPGSFHPAYGMPPTANRWLPPLSSSQREQSLSVQRCSQWELSPGATTRREEIPGNNMTCSWINIFRVLASSRVRGTSFDIKIRNKFIEIKYSAPNRFIIFIKK